MSEFWVFWLSISVVAWLVALLDHTHVKRTKGEVGAPKNTEWYYYAIAVMLSLALYAMWPIYAAMQLTALTWKRKTFYSAMVDWHVKMKMRLLKSKARLRATEELIRRSLELAARLEARMASMDGLQARVLSAGERGDPGTALEAARDYIEASQEIDRMLEESKIALEVWEEMDP